MPLVNNTTEPGRLQGNLPGIDMKGKKQEFLAIC